MSTDLTRICETSGISFVVSGWEQQFFQRFGLPLPALCPDERARVRLAWRNERILYRRQCDATQKWIISIFDTGTPFPVYSQEHWWSDAWSALDYAKDFDFNRPFFEQFIELFHRVPQVALRCPQSENCEYTNQCEMNKDCYMVFCSNASRECLHGMWYQQCVNCIDCTYLQQGELCSGILNGKNCYGCTDCENVQNCNGCHFSRDLIGCSNCIACVNLRNKSYWIYNRPYSKEEYETEVAKLRLDTRSGRAAIRASFADFAADFAVKFYCGKNNEEFSGDYLENCKSVFEAFNCRNSEKLLYGRDAWSARNSIDLTETLEQDFCISLEGSYKNTDSGFSAKISETHSAWYSSHCFNCSNLFGCVGLKNQHYCILNKQYTKDEYAELYPRIVGHMRTTGEWGKHFPIEHSPFAYNESVANEYFPLTPAAAAARSLRWKNESPAVKPSAPAAAPETIAAVDDSVLQQTFVCAQTGRQFKVQPSELRLYRLLNLPLPELHPDVRHAARMTRRNPRILNSGACRKCGAGFQSTLPATSRAMVMCESCYEQSVE